MVKKLLLKNFLETPPSLGEVSILIFLFEVLKFLFATIRGCLNLFNNLLNLKIALLSSTPQRIMS